MNEEFQREEQERSILRHRFVTVAELATMMNVSATEVITACMNLGLMVSINQRLDAEALVVVAEEFGFKTEFVSADIQEAIGDDEQDSEEDLVPRPPIVTVMGHVDHGKTSLLDNIRKTNVIEGEAGGITQHIGAYSVELNGQKITFLDTPGHEAFTAMRARGAKITDVAIIIVAADDNVMPQTVEAINHAQAAGVPMVFAINKIDKPAANPDHIKEQLSQMNYLVESWGGKYQDQEVSAKKGPESRQTARKSAARSRNARPEGQSEPPRFGSRHRIDTRQGPRLRGYGARTKRYAAHRRRNAFGHTHGPCESDVQRKRPKK